MVKLGGEGKSLVTRPSPRRQADAKEVLGVRHVRHRELFEVAASGGKGRANPRIHDADGLYMHACRKEVSVLGFHQYRSKAVTDNLKDRDSPKSLGKTLDNDWKAYG